jgi:ketosteroid isomerase-like protein
VGVVRQLKSGTPIKYKGVSIVEFAGGKVKRFATYYDSAAFTSDGSKHAR